MPTPTKLQEDNVREITTNLKRCDDAINTAGRNIQNLLRSGRATCKDLKAYNSWAIALYQTQQATLATARAAGQLGLPPAPNMPFLFQVAGQPGALVNCDLSTNSLNGALAAAMEPITATTQFVDPATVRITGGMQYNLPPTPSFSSMANTAGGLGFIPVAFYIAGAVIALVAGAIYALAHFFEERAIQRETTARVALQLEAYSRQTETRMACYAACMGKPGADADSCTSACASLIPSADLKIDSARAQKGLSFFSTIGLVIVAAAGGLVAYKVFQRRRSFPQRTVADLEPAT